MRTINIKPKNITIALLKNIAHGLSQPTPFLNTLLAWPSIYLWNCTAHLFVFLMIIVSAVIEIKPKAIILSIIIIAFTYLLIRERRVALNLESALWRFIRDCPTEDELPEDGTGVMFLL